jgi:hypothetical protein
MITAHDKLSNEVELLNNEPLEAHDSQLVLAKIKSTLGDISKSIKKVKNMKWLPFLRIRTKASLNGDKSNTAEFSCIPKEKAPINRLNLPNFPAFYVATDSVTGRKEVTGKLEPYYLAVWYKPAGVDMSFAMFIDGVQEDTYKELINERNEAVKKQMTPHEFDEFLVSLRLYSKLVQSKANPPNEYFYTSILGHHFLYEAKQEHEVDALLYPSVHSNQHLNLAIHPNFCENLILWGVFLMQPHTDPKEEERPEYLQTGVLCEGKLQWRDSKPEDIDALEKFYMGRNEQIQLIF